MSQVSACLITVSVSLLVLVSVCCFFVSVFLVLVAGFGGKRREQKTAYTPLFIMGSVGFSKALNSIKGNVFRKGMSIARFWNFF